MKQKDSWKDISEFAEAEITLVHYILCALEEIAIHQRSKLEDPSTVPNPDWFRPPTVTFVGIARKRKKLLTCTQ
jgi:hypothetical protein